MIFFGLKRATRVSHIPRAKSVFAMVAKAGAVQQDLIVKLKSQSCPKLPKSTEIAPKMGFLALWNTKV